MKRIHVNMDDDIPSDSALRKVIAVLQRGDVPDEDNFPLTTQFTSGIVVVCTRHGVDLTFCVSR